MKTTNSHSTVKQAIQDFYKEHNFGDDGGENEKYAWIKFGFFSLPIPNIESRRKNIYLHDVNHIITENNTTWKGESAVASWEIASGGWGNYYFLWLLTLWAMGLGVLFYPSTILKAFKNGLTMKNGLTCGLSKNDMNKLSVTELQQTLSNKPKVNKNPFVWMAISFIIFSLPIIIFVISVLAIINYLNYGI